MTVCIGVTGGIGSGKSAVLAYLSERYGAALLRTDDIAKELMAPGGDCYGPLIAAFGDSILDESGSIDRKKYAARIYQNEAMRRRSDEIVHPRVWKETENRLALLKAKSVQLIVIETALPDSRFRALCDEIWYVFAEHGVRLLRLSESRGLSRKRCEEIMNTQNTDRDFYKTADLIIHNSGAFSETKDQIDAHMSRIIRTGAGYR